MSKIVVGMKSRPAITPQRIDCGLLKTMASARKTDGLSPASDALTVCDGSRNSNNAAMTRPATPIAVQNVAHDAPDAMIGPTTNCPAEPPAMPNICVAPINVAAFDAGKLVVAM